MKAIDIVIIALAVVLAGEVGFIVSIDQIPVVQSCRH